MLCEFRIVMQPPESIDGENNVRGAAPAQAFQICSRLLAIGRITGVNAVFLQKMAEYLRRGATNKPINAITVRIGVRLDVAVCTTMRQYHAKFSMRTPPAPKK